jgi:hypothetical protein
MIQISQTLKEKLTLGKGFPKRKAASTLKARIVDCLVCSDLNHF